MCVINELIKYLLEYLPTLTINIIKNLIIILSLIINTALIYIALKLYLIIVLHR